MFSRMRRCGGVPSTALVLAIGAWFISSSSAMAQLAVRQGDGVPATALAVTGTSSALQDDWSGGPVRWDPYHPLANGTAGMGGGGALHAWLREQCVAFDYGRKGALGHGTLGYDTSGNGDFGVHQGFHGFGMSFRRGYGYGGHGLGVGANGGDPYYGGPGYPHGGYDYPGPMFASDGPFGSFTGPSPYPEAYFAPFTAAAATGSASGRPLSIRSVVPGPKIFSPLPPSTPRPQTGLPAFPLLPALESRWSQWSPPTVCGV